MVLLRNSTTEPLTNGSGIVIVLIVLSGVSFDNDGGDCYGISMLAMVSEMVVVVLMVLVVVRHGKVR